VGETMYYYLYAITNLISNKIYIGQSNIPSRRWSNHKSQVNKGKPIQYIHRAMAKYGISNFTFEVIAMCRTQKDTDEIEMFLIKQYNSRNKEFGYNISPGGDVAWNRGLPKERQSMYGRHHTEESKRKISESNKGKIVIISDETKIKMSTVRKGKIKSDEWKRKISESNKKRIYSEEEKERLRTLNCGLIMTEEHKKKISESHIGKIFTEEHIKNIGLAKRKFSDEQELEIVKLKISGATAKELSIRYNCGVGTIWNILKRKNK
jgi:group I intron endonuclease